VKDTEEENQLTRVSALLEFFSGRAVAHSGFLIASVFGIVTFSAIVTQIKESMPPITYWISVLLFFAFAYIGYFTLVRFGYYAEIAHAISEYGLSRESTLKQIPTKKEKVETMQDIYAYKTDMQKRLLPIKRNLLGSRMTKVVYYIVYWGAILLLGVLVYSLHWKCFADGVAWISFYSEFIFITTIIPFTIELEEAKDEKRIFGYGEDCLTLWALKNHISKILEEHEDRSTPSNCIAFYRPSFGRSGGSNSPEFGEFDAIIASPVNIYLIESKWDNVSGTKRDEALVKPVQKLRHKVFSWYLIHWKRSLSKDWERFIEENEKDFKEALRGEKQIAKNKESLLAKNLEQTLNMLIEHCRGFQGEQNIKNVLLYFHRTEPDSPSEPEGFELIHINYSKNVAGNFVILE
jgi:hypothetical protein